MMFVAARRVPLRTACVCVRPRLYSEVRIAVRVHRTRERRLKRHGARDPGQPRAGAAS